MGMSRYAFTAKLENGKFFGTWNGGNVIFHATDRGALAYTVKIVKEGVRLDHISGNVYGDPGCIHQCLDVMGAHMFFSKYKVNFSKPGSEFCTMLIINPELSYAKFIIKIRRLLFW